MSTTTATTATTSVHRSGWAQARHIGLWAVRVILAAQFVAGGALKLTADPAMVAMFNDIGAGDWLRLLVGVCEVGGGVGLLAPRLVRPAATGLVLLMAGAAVTNVVALGTSPAIPLTLLALAAVVATPPTRKDVAR
jgi:uncharacterized membrane protein YphA (DoxX/SURF4 family)